MRNKISKKELAHGAFVFLGWILLLSLVSRVWIIFFISLAITLFLIIKSKLKKKEDNSTSISVIESPEARCEDDWFAVILKQINEQVKNAYPDAKWVWRNPNARKSIEAGEEVMICLNKAAGYKFAKVIISDLTVQGLDFTVNVKQNVSDETETEDEELSRIPRGEDNVNYDLLAYEWVQDNILLLNERINELIGQEQTELIIPSEELPIKESWRNICSELMREGKHYYLRKEVKRIRTVSLDEMDSEILYYEINNEKIEDFFFGDEKIYNAYKELSCMRKKVLRLLFIHEMTIMEISKELNIPSSYVSNLKYYALKKLKENIEKELKK